MGPESDKYRLNLTGYSGDAGDALAAPVHPDRTANGMKFTAPDQDNDMSAGHQCGRGRSGGWYNNCGRSTLNKNGNGDWNAETDVWIPDVTDARMLIKLD